ncbi:MAG: phage tail assembly protein [Chloroflexi bacterium]|nr:phage tail assembly protein [Chloroflexota bacterium]
MNLKTEFEFELPMGYVDKEGTLHKKGTMRLATAMDEITILNDMRVQTNEAYIVIVLLARVITELGSLRSITTNVIENLFAADLTYLQEFYRQINESGHTRREYACPHCEENFELDISTLGGE